jgi:hypothetical protein
MATQKQIEANRLNAQRSTGPRTPEGLAASSQNALTHGLTASQIIVSGESDDEFLAYYRERRDAEKPEGPIEEGLLERIVICEWRQRRAYRAEAGLLETGGGAEDVFHGMDREMAVLSRYETALDRSLQRARHELERRQARRRGEAVVAPIAVTVSGAVDISGQSRPRPKARRSDGETQMSMSLPAPMADADSTDTASEDVCHSPANPER